MVYRNNTYNPMNLENELPISQNKPFGKPLPAVSPEMAPAAAPKTPTATAPAATPKTPSAVSPEMAPKTPVMAPIMAPTTNPNMNPNMNPVMAPEMVTGKNAPMAPIMNPIMAPTMVSGKNSSMSPSMQSSMMPSMSPSMQSSMMPSMSSSMSPFMSPQATGAASLPSGAPSGGPYGGTPVAAAAAGVPLTSAVPQTVQNPYYTAGFLRNFIGRDVRIEFLMGTSGPLVDRIGTLLEVGASYVVIRPIRSNDRLMCDIYSIKFVTIYGGPNGSTY